MHKGKTVFWGSFLGGVNPNSLKARKVSKIFKVGSQSA